MDETILKKKKAPNLVSPQKVNEIIESIKKLPIIDALQTIQSEKSLTTIDRMFVTYEYGRQIGEAMGYMKGYNQGKVDLMQQTLRGG